MESIGSDHLKFRPLSESAGRPQGNGYGTPRDSARPLRFLPPSVSHHQSGRIGRCLHRRRRRLAAMPGLGTFATVPGELPRIPGASCEGRGMTNLLDIQGRISYPQFDGRAGPAIRHCHGCQEEIDRRVTGDRGGELPAGSRAELVRKR